MATPSEQVLEFFKKQDRKAEEEIFQQFLTDNAVRNLDVSSVFIEFHPAHRVLLKEA